MPSTKWLDTTTDVNNYLSSKSYVIMIDGYEYIAITDRTYSFSTTSPSRCIQEGFDYSGHSIIQPATVNYTIVVSKGNQSELTRLLQLYNSRERFELINPVHAISQCMISSLSIKDEYENTLTISLTLQELNNSIQFNHSSTPEFQASHDIGFGSKSADADTSELFISNEKADSVNYIELSKDAMTMGSMEWLGVPYAFSAENISDVRVVYKNNNNYTIEENGKTLSNMEANSQTPTYVSNVTNIFSSV